MLSIVATFKFRLGNKKKQGRRIKCPSRFAFLVRSRILLKPSNQIWLQNQNKK